jgi:hypothetical protein
MTSPPMTSSTMTVRGHHVVPLRWRGIALHNVVALFPDLQDASTAAQRLAALPSSVSAAVLVPVDPNDAMSVVVGVHTTQRDVADEAAVSLRRSGAQRVVRFPGPTLG